jgi:hypothetical protein
VKLLITPSKMEIPDVEAETERSQLGDPIRIEFN